VIKTHNFLLEQRNILELVLGYSCNNNCLYCNLNNKNKSKDRSLAESKNILRQQKKEREILIITGGEPTLRFTELLELIEFAINPSVGFKCIQLETNARMFSYLTYCSKLCDLLNKNNLNFDLLFEVALCDSSPRLHEKITCVPGSFEQTISGIKNLKSVFGIEKVCIKVIINKLNYKNVENIVKLVFNNLGMRHIEFALHQPREGIQDTMSLSYHDFAPYLQKLLNLKLNKDQYIYIDNIPLCLLKDKEKMLSSHYYSQGHGNFFKKFDLDKVLTEIDNKILCKYVESCHYGLTCDGIDKGYVEKYGYAGILKQKTNFDSNSSSLIFKENKIRKTKADAISHLSGGVDSKIASAIFAKDNPDKKIVLITYNVGVETSTNLSKISAREIMKKHNNVVAHYIITFPRNIVNHVLLYGLKNTKNNDGTLWACSLCGYFMLAASVYLHKRIFKGSIIIEGLRLAGLGLKKFHADERVYFGKRYKIKLTYPLLEVADKGNVFKLARKMGFSEETNNQGVCFFKNSKIARQYKDSLLNTNIKNGSNHEENYDFIETNNRIKFFRELLKSYGITPSISLQNTEESA